MAESNANNAEKAEQKPRRVAPRLARKPKAAAAKADERYVPADMSEALAFVMSIAKEKKQADARAEKAAAESDIQLSERPVSRSEKRNTGKFPAADLREFKKRLLAARASILSGASAIKDTGFNDSDDHEVDGGDGTNQTLRLQAMGQVGNMNRTVQQIDEALHRIEDGTYGICTACGKLIRKPRLLNQPFATTCMECQNAMERESQNP